MKYNTYRILCCCYYAFIFGCIETEKNVIFMAANIIISHQLCIVAGSLCYGKGTVNNTLNCKTILKQTELNWSKQNNQGYQMFDQYSRILNMHVWIIILEC